MLTASQEYKEYYAIKGNMANILQISGYKDEDVAVKLDMPIQDFATKKKQNSWSPDEVKNILEAIYNDDVEGAVMVAIMESRKNDETITYEEYKKEIASWK